MRISRHFAVPLTIAIPLAVYVELRVPLTRRGQRLAYTRALKAKISIPIPESSHL